MPAKPTTNHLQQENQNDISDAEKDATHDWNNHDHFYEELDQDPWDDSDWADQDNHIPPYPKKTLKKKFFVLLNKFFGFQRTTPKTPSPQAITDWLGYYHQLYQTSSPDVDMFRHLLLTHGMWDFKTPFREGNASFYSFHPDCVFLADVNFLLDRYIDKYLTPKLSSPTSFEDQNLKSYLLGTPEDEVETLFQKAQSRWLPLFGHRPQQNPYLSVDDSMQEQSRKAGQKRALWHNTAVVVLENLFLSHPSNWGYFSQYLHADNRKILCQMVYKNTQNHALLEAWKKQGWLSEKDVLSLRTFTTEG